MLRAPVKGRKQITELRIFDDKLYVGYRESTIAIFDLNKVTTGTGLYDVLLFDTNSGLYGTPVLFIQPLAHPNFVAVAYKGGLVGIWDLARRLLVKKVQGCDEIIEIALSDNNRFLDIMYRNGAVERHFIAESASIEDILKVMKKRDLGD